MEPAKPEHLCEDCGSFQSTAFCCMSQQGRSFLQGRKTLVKFPKGKYIFNEGESSRGIYCISNGLVKLERTSKSGGVRLLNVLQDGDLLGCRTVFSNEKYTVSAVALEDTIACFVPRGVLLSLVEKEPALAIELLSDISREAKRNDTRLYQSTEVNASGRVADTLLFLKEHLKSRRWTRAEIAAWAGTTTETVVRCLTQFEKDALVTLNGHRIEIKDKAGLKRLIH